MLKLMVKRAKLLTKLGYILVMLLLGYVAFKMSNIICMLFLLLGEIGFKPCFLLVKPLNQLIYQRLLVDRGRYRNISFHFGHGLLMHKMTMSIVKNMEVGIGVKNKEVIM